MNGPFSTVKLSHISVLRAFFELLSFRVPLLAEWAGKRGDELSKLVGLPGCVFVHVNCFLGVHTTYDGALQMALKSLKAAKYL